MPIAMANDLTIEATHGKAMKALPNDNWRHFAMMYCGQGGRNATRAYAAVYGKDLNNPTDRRNCECQGSKLLHDQRIQDAILELSQRNARALLPLALQVFEDIATSEKHPGRLAAAKELADRGGLHTVTENRHVVQHLNDDEGMQKQIAAMARFMGIDPARLLGNRIEAPLVTIDQSDWKEVVPPEPVHSGRPGDNTLPPSHGAGAVAPVQHYEEPPVW